ncbi:MAG: MerR family transcriptional regulator [Erysipelotrichaceae bacterium]|nr:MerR family transcriptional regulator [Erysipelotrichaceae bacterium]
MKSYYKINEIAKLYNIGIDSLRYYEKVGLISPTRSENGYRLYSLSDIWVLNVIRDCLKLGFHTSKIKTYLKQRSIASTQQLLQEEQQAIEKQIQLLNQQLNDIQHRQQEITNALQLPVNQCQIQHFPLRHCWYLKETIHQEEEIDYLLTKLSKKLENNISIIGNSDTGSIIELTPQQKWKYTSVFIVDPQNQDADFILPEGTYCTYTYRGEYDRSNKIIDEMINYIEKHNYQAIGPFMEFLFIDIHETNNTSEYITQLQILVKSMNLII